MNWAEAAYPAWFPGPSPNRTDSPFIYRYYAASGNYIGVATNGTTGAGNGATGVTIIDSPNNTIGGTVAASRNVISDNGAQGVQISSFSSTGNFVQGNYIGTSADGMSAISNGLNGVEIVDASTNSVGGALVGAGNVISGNSTGAGLANGVYSHGFTNSCDVFGNYIGIAADGSTALANGANGVLTGDNGLAIGTGTTLGRNVISGNTGSGVMTGGSGGGATIWANYIGLDASGTSAVGNGLAGVTLQDSVVVEVGDPMPGFGNVVSGNTGNGIAVLGATVSSFIAGNSVGTDGSGSGSIGNGGNGIVAADNALVDFFANNVVGSSQNGIVISDNASVDIIQTTVSGSGSLGIDLNNDGITANDPLDADSGPNTLQNFPIITSANYDGMLHVAGTLSSMQNMQYHIEVFVSDSCSSSGNGEGQYFAGSVDVSTDFTGDAPFTLDVFPGFPLNPGSVATATASLLDVPPGRSNGPSNPDTTLVPYNTSEFSPCVAIMLPPGPDLSITMGGVPDPVAPLGDVTYTISVTNNDLKAVADGVVVNGTTPAGMTFQSWSVPGGWATTDPGAGNAGAYSAQTAMLFSGTEVLTLVLRVDASTPGGTMLDNTVVVTQSASETDTSNNMATATVTVVGSPSADLSVTVDGTPDPVGAGSEATFTITVANAGPTDTGVILDSAVPDNTTLVSLTAPPGWSCKAPGPGGTGGISCSTQLLASGTQQTFTLVVLVDEGTADGTLITTTASVQGFDPDPNTGNNTASKSITVAPPDAADLQLNLSAAPNPVAVGGTLTYTLEVNNLGPAAANDVTLNNTLPQLVGFVSATASTGGSITAPAMGQTGIVSCSWPGATAPVELHVYGAGPDEDELR